MDLPKEQLVQLILAAEYLESMLCIERPAVYQDADPGAYSIIDMATFSAYNQMKASIICGVAGWARGISDEKPAHENGSAKKAQWLLRQNGSSTTFAIAQGFEGFEEVQRSTARRSS